MYKRQTKKKFKLVLKSFKTVHYSNLDYNRLFNMRYVFVFLNYFWYLSVPLFVVESLSPGNTKRTGNCRL